MNSNHCQLFTILIGFRTASPDNRQTHRDPVIIKSNSLRTCLELTSLGES